jgi:hypothetical protein
MHQHHMNGHTSLPPPEPNGILFTLGKHSAEIARLNTRVDRLEQPRRPPFPWKDLLPALWTGLVFLGVLLGNLSLRDAISLLGRG